LCISSANSCTSDDELTRDTLLFLLDPSPVSCCCFSSLSHANPVRQSMHSASTLVSPVTDLRSQPIKGHQTHARLQSNRTSCSRSCALDMSIIPVQCAVEDE
jgi:hypothetical protein